MHVLSFKPEMVLYFYMANCIAVLIFNIIYIFIDKYQGRRNKKRSTRLEAMIRGQLELLASGQPVAPEHIKQLKRMLKRLTKLKAFEDSLGAVSSKALDGYIRQLRPVFIALTSVYEKRDFIEQAYFAWLIEKLGVDRGQASYDAIVNLLLAMVSRPDVHVRENALRALYSIGFADAVLSAWTIMENGEINHSVKLLTDGLLSFSGDRQALAELLYSRRKHFSQRLNLPVMQFIRFESGNFCQAFLELLQQDAEDKELRLEAIRYLGRYPYAPARGTLQQLIRYEEYIDWEFAAMSARALANYPGADTETALKEGLHARNWYVRLNCAEALVDGLKLPVLKLYDVYNSRDRYAREILQYVSEKSDIKNQSLKLEDVDV